MRLHHLHGFFAAAAFFASGTIASAQSLDLNNALNADSATQSIFIMGYETWWGSNYNFNLPGEFDANTNQNVYSPEETAMFNGTGPNPDPGSWIYRTPSLNATVSTPSGMQTFTATAGPGFSPGYVSNNDSVIKYHAQLISNLGVQALAIDLTNFSSSMFSSPVSYSNTQAASGNSPTDALKSFARVLQNLDGNIQSGVPPLYVIPAMGALATQDAALVWHETDIAVGSDGLSPFQHALMFAIDALDAHQNRAVKFQGKPLILVYHGTHDVPNLISMSDKQANAVAAMPGYSNFTLRHMAGLVNAIPDLWSSNARTTVSTASPQMYTRMQDGLWTWYDRVYTDSFDGFACYSQIPSNAPYNAGQVEMIAGTFTSWAETQTPFLTTRHGEVLNYSMSEARQLHPRFVIVNQFNQFLNDTAGFTIDGSINCEPTMDLDGTVHTELYNIAQAAIASYRAYESGGGIARFTDISLRAQVATNSGGDPELQDFSFTIGGGDATTPQRVVMKTMGPSLQSLFQSIGSYGITTASSPALELVAGDVQNGNWQFDAKNSNYSQAVAATSYGSDLISALGRRTFQNSPTYLNALNYGQRLSTSEPGITADLDPGTYSLFVTDSSYGGGAPGPMTHTRIVPSDLIGSNRITDFSVRTYVSSSSYSVILGMTVDKSKNVLISTMGPSLAPYMGSTPVLQHPHVELHATINGADTVQNSWDGEVTNQSQTLSPNIAYTLILTNPDNRTATDGVGWMDVKEN